MTGAFVYPGVMTKYKVLTYVFAALTVFLFIVMAVRVGDKDNRIGDLLEDNKALSAELAEARDYNEAVSSEVKRLDSTLEDLLVLQDSTVTWGLCLEKWGMEVSQGLDTAPATKVRCDTDLAEMNVKAGK